MLELLEVDIILAACNAVLEAEEPQNQRELDKLVAVLLVPGLAGSDDVVGRIVGARLEARKSFKDIPADALVAHFAPSLLEGGDEVLLRGHPMRDPGCSFLKIIIVGCFKSKRHGEVIRGNKIVFRFSLVRYNRVRDTSNIGVGPDRSPVCLRVGQVDSVQARGARRARFSSVGDVGVRALRYLFEIKVFFEPHPSLDKPFIIIVMFRVRRRVFVLVLHKVEISPHYHVRMRRKRFCQSIELGGSSVRFVRVKIEIKRKKGVGLVFGCEADTERLPFEGRGEGDNLVVIQIVQVGGDNRCHPR